MRKRTRALTCAMLFGVAFFLAGIGTAPAASAHPLGNFTINRYSGIVLEPGRIEVRYVLDLAEIPTFQEQPNLDTDADGIASDAERQAWADAKASAILSNLSLTLGGTRIPLTVERDEVRFREGQAGLPILYFTATFTSTLPSTSGSLAYADGNEPGRIGWREITVRSEEDVSVFGASVPATSVTQELRAYPSDLLSSPLAVTSASFSFRPGHGTGVVRAKAAGRTVRGAPVADGGSFANLIRWRLTPVVLMASLLLALAFGALHALGPGHGKTITAAYLVGTGARVGQAVAVGAAVALMHTASVLALGLVLFVLTRSFPAEQVYPWLTLATGLVALGLGAGLFVARLHARPRGSELVRGHAHPWDGSHDHHVGFERGHAHPHARTGYGPDFEMAGGGVALLERVDIAPQGEDDSGRLEDEPVPNRALSARGIAALALAGGILPSPTAFVVLTGAISAHRIGYGLALISAFSIGLAGALIGIGLLALRARTLVAARLQARWAGLIPPVSALLIVGFGLFFLARGLTQVA
jgi:nickel/cobalt exporter